MKFKRYSFRRQAACFSYRDWCLEVSIENSGVSCLSHSSSSGDIASNSSDIHKADNFIMRRYRLKFIQVTLGLLLHLCLDSLSSLNDSMSSLHRQLVRHKLCAASDPLPPWLCIASVVMKCLYRSLVRLRYYRLQLNDCHVIRTSVDLRFGSEIYMKRYSFKFLQVSLDLLLRLCLNRLSTLNGYRNTLHSNLVRHKLCIASDLLPPWLSPASDHIRCLYRSLIRLKLYRLPVKNLVEHRA